MTQFKNPKNFLNKEFYTVLFLCLTFLSQTLSAQDNKWQEAKFYPGSKIVFNQVVNFSDCYQRLPTNYNLWFNCKDKGFKSPMNWDKIASKITKTSYFTLKPGHLSFEFETTVADNIFYHQDPTFSIVTKNKNGKWESVWTGGSLYYSNYRGKTLKDHSNKLKYLIKPDGTLKYWTIPPLYKAGTYKVTFHPAERRGAYDLAFVKSKASLKVYFMEEGAKVNNVADTPKRDSKLTFGKNWHANKKVKIGLARIVSYLRRRAHELSKTKPAMAALFRTYADRIMTADFYYIPKYGKGEANCTRFFHNINLFNGLVLQNPIFNGEKSVFKDKDLGEATSTIMHEISHKYKANEWQAHYLQKLTFDDLKVPEFTWDYYHTEKNISPLRIYNNKFFKKYPKNTIWAEFYRWTVK